MSLWTPGGEVPVERGRRGARRQRCGRPGRRPRPRRAQPRGAGPGRGDDRPDGRGPAPDPLGPGRPVRDQPRRRLLRAGRHPPRRSPSPTSTRPASPSTPCRRVLDALEDRLGEDERHAARRAGPAPDWSSCRCKATLRRTPATTGRPTPAARAAATPRPAQAGGAGRTASQRPSRPGDHVEGHRGADLDGAGAVGDARCSGTGSSSPSSAVTVAEADAVVERRSTRAGAGRAPPRGRAGRHGQWTILESGSSMMSVAPASLSAGISTLIAALRRPRSRPRSRRRRRARSPSATSSTGSRSMTASRSVGGDVELHQHLAPGLEHALEQGADLVHGVAPSPGRRRPPGWRRARCRTCRIVSMILSPAARRARPGLGDLDDAVDDVGDLGLGGAVGEADVGVDALARRRTAG